MEFYRRVLLLLVPLAAIAAAQVGANTENGQIQDGIDKVSVDFHNRIAQIREGPSAASGQLGEVSLNELNLELARTKLELLEKFPTEATPLRNYVVRHFPGALKPSTGATVGTATIDKTVTETDSLLNDLRKASPYRLDLIVDSEPRNALFQLQSPTGESISMGTRGTLTNIWRGEYQYTVIKAGQKTITGSVDLIRERGDSLLCHFVSSLSPDSSLPCELTSSH